MINVGDKLTVKKTNVVGEVLSVNRDNHTYKVMWNGSTISVSEEVLSHILEVPVIKDDEPKKATAKKAATKKAVKKEAK